MSTLIQLEKKNSDITAELNKASVRISKHRRRSAMANGFILDAASKIKNVNIIDPTAIFCNDYCPVGDMKTAYYIDDSHVSKNGAQRLAPLFLPYFKK